MRKDFVHLHCHSGYSIIDGAIHIEPWLQSCSKMGMNACAITDWHNIFAAVKFYKYAKKYNIKPIFGARILLKVNDRVGSLVLLCRNKTGLNNLMKLLSFGYKSASRQDVPVLELEDFMQYTAGNIILLGGTDSILSALIESNQTDEIDRLIETLEALFPSCLYIELQCFDKKDWNTDSMLAAHVSIATYHQIPVVATNNVCFLNEKDYKAHQARVAICRGVDLKDPILMKYNSKQYLKSPDEMHDLFSDLPSAIINGLEIAKRCNVVFELGSVHLPNFPTPKNVNCADYLESKSSGNLQKYLSTKDAFLKIRNIYTDRLKFELDVIIKMNFASYFLIVADFINWAKQNDIPVGPGRGSGAGSLVAYVLGITDLDPIEHDLLFERFLNPERVSMPDFDIDFCQDRRDEVISYVTQKYGQDSVCQIITFGTMAAKAAIRDAGRILQFAYGFVDKIAKLIPFQIGITIHKAIEQEPALADVYNNEEEVKTIIDLAIKLEGLPRNVGKHAGGVVIAPSNLTDYTALYYEDSADNRTAICQFDKDDIESIGLIKFDFLGLKTLTVIRSTEKILDSIGIKVNVNHLKLDDAKTFELLQSGMTTAVFQLESRGMRELVKKLKPDSFDDIVALVALYRPGPLQSGMVDDFINRKHGREEITYLHDDLSDILNTTYGVILYQEQVMQIAQKLAGYSLGGADLLRRAMGKKKPEEMAKQRKIFLDGAAVNNINIKIAEEIFDLMEKFAGYGFNKSHSAAYALISYHTAYLKAHYPSAFMAAVMSSDMGNPDKLEIYIEECRLNNLNLVAPNILRSGYEFSIENKSILYGLGAIKGVGESSVLHIVSIRKQKQFSSLYDFCMRVSLDYVNKKTIESLIDSGSFDCFKINRDALHRFNLLEQMRQIKLQGLVESQGQASLFQFNDLSDKFKKLISTELRITHSSLLKEASCLGTFISSHPTSLLRLEHKKTNTLKNLGNNSINNLPCLIWLKSISRKFTKRGDRFLVLAIEDDTMKIEVPIMAKQMPILEPILFPNNAYLANIKFVDRNYRQMYIVENISPIKSDISKIKCCNLDLTNITDDRLKILHELLSANSKSKDNNQTTINEVNEVKLKFWCNVGEYRVCLESKKFININLTKDLNQELEQLLDASSITLEY